MPVKKSKSKNDIPETPEVPQEPVFVKMVRKGRVFDAPAVDVPNMLKNGWMVVDEEALQKAVESVGKEIVNLALSKT